MNERFRYSYGGLWRYAAIAAISSAVTLLVLWLIVKHIVPEISGAMLGTIFHGFGL